MFSWENNMNAGIRIGASLDLTCLGLQLVIIFENIDHSSTKSKLMFVNVLFLPETQRLIMED